MTYLRNLRQFTECFHHEKVQIKVQDWWGNKMCHHIKINNRCKFKALLFITSELFYQIQNVKAFPKDVQCLLPKCFFFSSAWFALANDSPLESLRTLHCLRYLNDLSYPFIIYSSCLLPKLWVTDGINF